MHGSFQARLFLHVNHLGSQLLEVLHILAVGERSDRSHLAFELVVGQEQLGDGSTGVSVCCRDGNVALLLGGRILGHRFLSDSRFRRSWLEFNLAGWGGTVRPTSHAEPLADECATGSGVTFSEGRILQASTQVSQDRTLHTNRLSSPLLESRHQSQPGVIAELGTRRVR